MYKLCKSEQSAVRQRELEQSLMGLMNTCRYEEITVSDFCTYAGIPRKAFYRYFSSKDGALYALLDHTLMEYEAFEAALPPDGSGTVLRDLEGFFLFWKSQAAFLDALEHSGLIGSLLERAMGQAARHPMLNRLLAKEDSRTRDHIVQFSVCGLMVMMVNWRRCGFRESTLEMAQIAVRLMTQPLFPTVDVL